MERFGHSTLLLWHEFPRELTDVVVRCTQSKRVSKIGTICAPPKGMAQMASYLNRVRDHKELLHFERMLDLIEGSPATSKSVAGIINLVAADLFGTGGTEMEQSVLAKLRNSTLVQKTGMTCTSQDQALRSVKQGRSKNWR